MVERTEHKVFFAGLPTSANGLRIAHLTDFHRSRMTHDRLLRHAVALANGCRPDLVVLTGDFVTNRAVDIEPCARILSSLRARYGVYAILGNHDYATDAAAVEHALVHHNIRVLKNDCEMLPNGLRLVGLDDDRGGQTDVVRAFEGIGRDEFTLTVIHNPALVELVSDRNCLVLAGHTHGGQMRVQLVTAWAVRHIGSKHYRSGWYRVGKAQMYVNRGLGRVGIPIRFLSRPEMAIYTLEGTTAVGRLPQHNRSPARHYVGP